MVRGQLRGTSRTFCFLHAGQAFAFLVVIADQAFSFAVCREASSLKDVWRDNFGTFANGDCTDLGGRWGSVKLWLDFEAPFVVVSSSGPVTLDVTFIGTSHSGAGLGCPLLVMDVALHVRFIVSIFLRHRAKIRRDGTRKSRKSCKHAEEPKYLL